ncbi:MAG TPA: DUF4097 family beta strand repeat-containing protein [Bryobacteraceae bacterium]|nr:DUF4097 family beta strand repeat-containing protein [Bryobacteraceae bacterium]
MILGIAVSKGDVTIGYSRDGEVSISASARDAAGKSWPIEFFESRFNIEQEENHITIRNSPNANYPDPTAVSISYKVGVPFRTEVSSTISGTGRQIIVGITGPARVVTSIGDIEASHVRFGLLRARTGKGNISCTRVAQVEAETGSGNITLLEDGPSTATVEKGLGRLEVSGARGRFEGSTDKGEIHIKAVLYDDWQLKSRSGNIRIELPPGVKFEADVATNSGELSVERADMEKPNAAARQCHQNVNGGGKRIQARSDAGNISIE